MSTLSQAQFLLLGFFNSFLAVISLQNLLICGGRENHVMNGPDTVRSGCIALALRVLLLDELLIYLDKAINNSSLTETRQGHGTSSLAYVFRQVSTVQHLK